MIEAILPSAVVAVETRQDTVDITLFPAEEALIARAVEKRRREFTSARACARDALGQLGLPASAIVNGPRGEPCWPPGVVGSITHCDGYRACAIAHASKMASIGIDAEPHDALPYGVLSSIAGAQELAWLGNREQESPEVHWDRLLFSIKESVYKAWFPLERRRLSFDDAVITVEPATQTFTARLRGSGPRVAGRRLTSFTGRWLIRDGLLLTAIALPAQLPA